MYVQSVQYDSIDWWYPQLDSNANIGEGEAVFTALLYIPVLYCNVLKCKIYPYNTLLYCTVIYSYTVL